MIDLFLLVNRRQRCLLGGGTRNLTHENQHVVRDLPPMVERSEIAQYHRRIKQKLGFEISSMTHLDRYLTSMEYEVFAIGALMRGAKFARASYEDAFNGFYEFFLQSVDVVLSGLRGLETFIIQLNVESYTFDVQDSTFASLPRIDVVTKSRSAEFVERVLIMKDYQLIYRGKAIQRHR